MAVIQLFAAPHAVKVLGIAAWQRLGCLLSVPAFVAISSAKALSWSDGSLFVVSVAFVTLVYCCQAMVRLFNSHSV